MHLDADDLCAQFNRDWPTEYEISRLRLLADVQDQEIQRLNSMLPTTTYSASSPRPYVLPTDNQEASRA